MDLVRQVTTSYPKAIGYLIEHPEILPRCDDPYTLLEAWRPLGNLCVYFIRVREDNYLAEWVITDGLFNQSWPAKKMVNKPGACPEPEFDGLLGDVLAAARAAWSTTQPSKAFPLFPGPSGLPEAVILHRYESGDAFIAPYDATMEVLSSQENL